MSSGEPLSDEEIVDAIRATRKADQATSTPSRTGEEGKTLGQMSDAEISEAEAELVREYSGEDASASESANERKGGPFGGLTASEAAYRRAEAARERRKQAEQDAQNARLTARDRFGVALSKIAQSDLDEVVQAMVKEAKAGKPQAIAALARMADQAFGRPTPAEGEEPEAEGDARKLTREERSELIAMMQERRRLQEQAAGDSVDPRASAPEGGGAPPP
jgi:hypothetical protein